MHTEQPTADQIKAFQDNLKGMLELHPNIKVFFITKDLTVFTAAGVAVEHAVALCPGNPEVKEVKRNDVDELIAQMEDKPADNTINGAVTNEPVNAGTTVELPKDATASEQINQQRIEATNAAEKKVKDLKEQIEKLDDGKDIDEENIAAKTQLAALKEQLLDAELELKNLQ